ncbi:MAG: type II secretion system F family protein [Pirellulaceae bacterium]
MPTFEFRARHSNGQLETGQIEAATRSAVAAQLQGRGLVVTDVQPVAKASASRFSFSQLNWRRSARSVEVELGLQQLALMLRSGTNLLTALGALRDSSASARARHLWGDIANQIQSGESLSQAMSTQRSFSEFTVQLVRVGEQTGNLAPVIERAADSMKSRRSVAEEIVSALIYPLLVIAMSIGVTMYMVVYLIPKLEVYLQSLGREIPPMTQTLLSGSLWLRESYPLLIGALVVLTGIPLAVYSTREGRVWIDRLLLMVPFVGGLIRMADTANFARSLSMLIGNGVTLTEGLGITESLLHNRFSGTIVRSAKELIVHGSNLANAIDEPLAFTPMLKQMVAIGEQSGNMEEVLRETADFHENQFLSIMRRLNSLITPALTIIVGTVVGYVYIAFFMALFAAAG